MRICNQKYSKIAVLIVAGVMSVISLASCKIKDEVAPILKLKGSESVNHILNQPYKDAGATATDDTDGNISQSIYVLNYVNENFLGYYDVIYNVVDQAGNSAIPISRTVRVINSSWQKMGNYKASVVQIFPEKDTCFYDMYFNADSATNNRMVFTSFDCEPGLNVFADLNDTLIVVPFQTIQDSVRKFSFWGAGYINDTLIYIEYSKKSDSLTSYWKAVFNKQL